MKKLVGIITLLTMNAMASNAVIANDWKSYQVTIKNATSHHVITPPLIVIHNRDFKLFEVTGIASDGLARQAETGDNSVLYGELNGAEGVYNVVAASAPIIYGNTMTFDIRAPKKAKISVVGMLATTNDALTAVLSKALPRNNVVYMATTYDAGSEANNEGCEYIPGPPCSAESGNLRATTGAEGFITVHSGIRGANDLNAAHLDWRGATSVVSIKRIHH